MVSALQLQNLERHSAWAALVVLNLLFPTFRGMDGLGLSLGATVALLLLWQMLKWLRPAEVVGAAIALAVTFMRFSTKASTSNLLNYVGSLMDIVLCFAGIGLFLVLLNRVWLRRRPGLHPVLVGACSSVLLYYLGPWTLQLLMLPLYLILGGHPG